MNSEQRAAFEGIEVAVNQGGGLIFLDGPAGTGKTFLYKVIIAEMEIQGKKTMKLATTGIAADLLGDGRTVHSGFKLPIPLMENSISGIEIGTPEAENLKNVSIVLIDEASMLSKYGLEAINEVLQRVCEDTRIFGGKTVLLGGDFRQTSNIVPRGSRIDIIEQSVKSSYLWNNVVIYKLTENMRCRGNVQFTDWLLKIGDGRLNDINDQITVPPHLVTEGDIVAQIFGTGGHGNIIDQDIAKKIILVSKNEDSRIINNSILRMIDSVEAEYISVDKVLSDDPSNVVNFPQEFLNAQQLSGMPPHKLKLKKGAIVMLLRNLDPGIGLLNGTRLIVREMRTNFIMGEIITGKRRGSIVPIPKIDIAPSETSLPFTLSRFQLPVILAFAMTIHKAQGQTFNKVGLYLPTQLFTHGQLYVALSRVQEESELKIVMPPRSEGKLTNIVYQELL